MREPFACWRHAMLLNVRHFAKSKHVAIRQKHWVVAETPLTAWRPDEGAVHRGVELFHMPIGPGEAERADELRLTFLGSLRTALAQFIFHRLHGTSEVLFGTRPARRVNPGLAAERVDGQSGIRRKRGKGGGLCRRARLGARVLTESGPAPARLCPPKPARAHSSYPNRHKNPAPLFVFPGFRRPNQRAPRAPP